MSKFLLSENLERAALYYASKGLAVAPLAYPVRSAEGHLVCSCMQLADCAQPAAHSLLPNGDYPTNEHGQVLYWRVKFPYANVGVQARSSFDVLEVASTAAARRLTAALDGERVGTGPLLERSGGGWYALFRSERRPAGPTMIAGVSWLGPNALIPMPPSIDIAERPFTWRQQPDFADLPSAPVIPSKSTRIGFGR